MHYRPNKKKPLSLQCSATCDEGSQTREVVCLTFVRGQYRMGLDLQCLARDKPKNAAPCNLGKCLPQWYTTDWSEVRFWTSFFLIILRFRRGLLELDSLSFRIEQCSATCGTGAQRREAKCLDLNQMPSQDCREEDWPQLRSACNIRTCNEGI